MKHPVPADLHPVVVHLTELRKTADFTQAEVAERIGVNYRQISLWERGAVSPRLVSLALWASAFDLPITTGEAS